MTRPCRSCRSSRVGSRCPSARSALRRSCSAGSISETGSRSRARSTASTSTRRARAGSCRTTSRGARATRRSRSRRSCGSRSRSTCSSCATSSGSSRWAASIGRSRASGAPRGLLRLEAKDDGIPGFAKNDYLDEEAFWARVDGAKELAQGFAQRIRAGDVRHDPKGGDCPAWCDLWRMCRVRRA